MREYIVDASVLVRGFTGSPQSKEIFAFLKQQKGKCYILSFTLIEVANALRYELKSAGLVKNALDNIERFRLNQFAISKEALNKATEIALEVNDTVYDALYHTLALSHNLTFITFDEKYYNKAKQIGNIELFK